MTETAKVIPGSLVKSLGPGKFGGFAVWFTDHTNPDCDGEYFDRDTDFELDDHPTVPILLSHGYDARVGRKRLGRVKLELRDEGLWAEGKFTVDDPVVRDLETLIREEKMFYSSSAPGHMTVKEKRRDVVYIKSWPPCEASLTSTPCSGGTTGVRSLKSFKGLSLDEMMRRRGLSEGELLLEESAEIQAMVAHTLSSAKCGYGCECESCGWIDHQRNRYAQHIELVGRRFNAPKNIEAMEKEAREELAKAAELRVMAQALIDRIKQDQAREAELYRRGLIKKIRHTRGRAYR